MSEDRWINSFNFPVGGKAGCDCFFSSGEGVKNVSKVVFSTFIDLTTGTSLQKEMYGIFRSKARFNFQAQVAIPSRCQDHLFIVFPRRNNVS